MDAGFGVQLTAEQLQALLLGNAPPPSETVAGAAGAGVQASRMDHQHPRLTSVTSHVTDASGEFTVSFTRSFTQAPGIGCTYVEVADNQPLLFKVKSWTQDAQNNYIGCVIKAYRAQTIPQNLATLLLGGVFNLFQGNASNITCSCIAVARSA